MSDLMPNKIYRYKSVVSKKTYTGSDTSIISSNVPARNYPITDNGVFVGANEINNSQYPYNCPCQDVRTTTLTSYDGDHIAVMGLNMRPNDNVREIPGIFLSWSAINDSRNVAMFLRTNSTSVTNNLFPETNQIFTIIEPLTDIPKLNKNDTVTLVADKLELCYKNDSKEWVYCTGISLLLYANDATIVAGGSGIIARAISMSGNGYMEKLDTSSVAFNDKGTVIGCLSGTDIVSVSGKISQSIPEKAMASNDGIVAVSCMASGDGYACWVGYKNGVYKLYQGNTPLYGMPGEKVTIKGHEFVCLAYGPFYARLS